MNIFLKSASFRLIIVSMHIVAAFTTRLFLNENFRNLPLCMKYNHLALVSYPLKQ